jgi:hypothetical protein
MECIVFLTPFYNTTGGHQTICRHVRDYCKARDIRLLVYPYLEPSIIRNGLRELKPDVVLFDWPPHPDQLAIEDLLHDEFPTIVTAAMMMYEPQSVSAKCHSSTDVLIELEPDAADFRPSVRHGYTRVLRGGPVVRYLPLLDTFVKHKDTVAVVKDACVVVTSGMPAERTEIEKAGRRVAETLRVSMLTTSDIAKMMGVANRYHPSVMAVAMAAGQLVIPAGYSTAWESLCYGRCPSDAIVWVKLPREVEDCERRIRLVSTTRVTPDLRESMQIGGTFHAAMCALEECVAAHKEVQQDGHIGSAEDSVGHG